MHKTRSIRACIQCVRSKPTMPVFDVCVIGAGLIGSAAAKYCAQSGVKVCLVGPAEPDLETYKSHHIFGSWFDEGRITRHLDEDRVWAHLAAESVTRYRSIETESGIDFYTENGYLLLADPHGEYGIEKTVETANQLHLRYELLQNEELRRRFPYFRIPQGMMGLYEKVGAGTINPRRLVQAQLKLMKMHGGVLMEDIAVKLDRDQTEGRNTICHIHTQKGHRIAAKKILVCGGSFLNHAPILPNGPALDISYRAVIVCRIRVSPGPLLDQLLTSMPSVKYTSGKNWGADGDAMVFYGLAPIRYPDGHYYLKFDYYSASQKWLQTPKEISEWIRSGADKNQEFGKRTAELAQKFIAGLDITDLKVDTCVWVETPTERPYIGEVADNFYIITGDNGYAAKSSDELGRIGAEMAMRNGEWSNSFLNQEDVEIRLKSRSSKL